MTLISLLLVLMLEHYFKVSAVLEKQFQSHKWFPNWQQWIAAKSTQTWFQGWGGISIILGIPILIVAAIADLDQGFLYWLIQLVLSVIVLIYCLGPIDQNAHLQKYFNAVEREDLQSAYHHVEDYLNMKADDHQQPAHLNALGRLVSRLILSQSNFRYFAILVYFILLGPAGALLYRLVGTFEFRVRDDNTSPYQQKLARLRTIVEWLPARVTGFLYTLAGDFTGAMSVLKRFLFSDDTQEKSMLEETGLGALGIKDSDCINIIEENCLALDLVKRSAVVLLVITAVLTVFGWLS